MCNRMCELETLFSKLLVSKELRLISPIKDSIRPRLFAPFSVLRCPIYLSQSNIQGIIILRFPLFHLKV